MPLNGRPVYAPATNSDVKQSSELTFVPLSGPAHKKRPRRRYDEIERLYLCGWQGCEKSYGTLNHLNAHVACKSTERSVCHQVCRTRSVGTDKC